MKRLASLFVLPMAIVASSAQSQVVVHTTPFTTTPVGTNDLEGIAAPYLPVNTPYSQDGVTVQYITTSGFDGPTYGWGFTGADLSGSGSKVCMRSVTMGLATSL
ncbi:MAG: hypothetical protein JWR80_5469 [Bradyrhizobium sp.]|nr:hypothetical protein [Bradyrhizobium sp.]